MTFSLATPAPGRLARITLATALLFSTTIGLTVVGTTSAAADGPTSFENLAAIAIPGADDQSLQPASPYPSPITVSGLTGAVSDVQVSFAGLTHTFANDIDAMVVAPTGENIVLMSDIGGANGFASASNSTLTFSDGATGTLPAAGDLVTGTYQPTNIDDGAADTFPAPAPAPSGQTTLAGAFGGVAANGEWQLFIVDDTGGDTGTMAGGWSLTLTTTVGAASTTTSIVSSGSPSTTGDSVTFTADVLSAGTPVVDGTVTFAVDGTALGAPVALSLAGSASISSSALAEGTHAITATYSGADGFLGSNGSVSQVVDNLTAVEGSTYCNTGPITVPAFGIPTPYGSHISISGQPGTITKVTAQLTGITHASPADLDILLVAPTGENLTLLSDLGGFNPVSNVDLLFDDDAGAGVPTGVALTSGTYLPTNDTTDGADFYPAPAPTPGVATTLGTFDGAVANGTWTLYVNDDATADAGSISGGWCVTVTSEAPTATALTSSLNPSVIGQSVTFTATVTSAGDPIATGTVDFSIDGGLAGSATVNGSGDATFSTSVLAAGTHPVIATFSGGGGYAPSSSDPVSQIVNDLDPSQTVLVAANNPAAVGEETLFTATVTSGGEPVTTGSVQFVVDGGGPIDPIDVDAAGQAQVSPVLAAGSYLVSASYSGTELIGESSDELTQVVDRIVTTSTLTSSLNPSVDGQTVTFTTTVAAGGTPLATGTVQFAVDGSPVGTPVAVDGVGVATLVTSSLAVGEHAVTADYQESATYAASNAAVTQIVNSRSGTTTTVTSSPNPSLVGDTVLIEMTVSADGEPVTTGQVLLSIDSLLVGSFGLDGNTGIISTDVSTLAAGDHTIDAEFVDDSAEPVFDGSSASTVQTVDLRPTITTLTADVNPSSVGDVVTFTATVSADGSPVSESGFVEFSVDGAPFTTVTVALDGTATFSLDQLAAGSHAITADYLGTDVFGNSTAELTQVVDRIVTTSTLTSSLNPSVVGQTVTFEATVTAGGTPLATGTVQFAVDGSPVGTPVAVDGFGKATLVTSSLAVGDHAVAADYQESATYAASDAALTQTVNSRSGTTTTVTSSPNPSLVGDTVLIEITVSADGEPVTRGQVLLLIDGLLVGLFGLDGNTGIISSDVSTLAAGDHLIDAEYFDYSAEPVFDGSFAATVQTVDLRPTITTLTADANPSSVGDVVTFTATVSADGSPVPGEGLLQFAVDGVPVATDEVDVDGTATFSTDQLAAGSHAITADYLGTDVFAAGTAALTELVNKVATVSTVVAEPNPVEYPDTVVFTGTVTAGGAPVTSGSVVLQDENGVPVAEPVALGLDGTATFEFPAVSPGIYPANLTYLGNETYATSSAPFEFVVNRASTETTLTSNGNPGLVGSPITFTVSVAFRDGVVPEGDVTLEIDGVVGDPIAVDGAGMATVTVPDLAFGSYSVTASYLGDDLSAPSSDALTQVVDRYSSVTTLASQNAPSVEGDDVTFVATVTTESEFDPTGTVQFVIDGIPVGEPVVLAVDGTVTFIAADLSAGTHSIVAAYSGDEAQLPSSSYELIQAVTPGADAGGPYSVAEGDGLALDGTGSTDDPDAVFSWDLNGDDDFSDAAGISPTLTWAELEALGIDDGPYSGIVTLLATTGDTSATATADLSVTNVAPEVVVEGPTSVTVGVPITLKVSAIDPSSADAAALFTYTVDWGDGSPVETVIGPADPPVTHTYTTVGNVAVAFTATDKDGAGRGQHTLIIGVVAATSATPTTPTSTATTTTTRPPTTGGKGGNLPYTGVSVLPPLAIGLILLGAGALLIMIGRRGDRRHHQQH